MALLLFLIETAEKIIVSTQTPIQDNLFGLLFSGKISSGLNNGGKNSAILLPPLRSQGFGTLLMPQLSADDRVFNATGPIERSKMYKFNKLCLISNANLGLDREHVERPLTTLPAHCTC